ncbi:TIGR00730 family Rossman fold protein [Flavobacteriaceae bacterium]|nr:TIGR00730 family Rossman fold protein [Flavobacteriaceae bacterium]
MKSIAIFCGASMSNDSILNMKAIELGKLLALKNIQLVYGGAKIGLMGNIANGVLENRGKVIGVIPEFLTSKEIVHESLTELIITETMHERKLKMYDISDGIVALPGGFGTLDELFEMLSWAQLGLHKKPIGVLNINGFYDDLLSFIEVMIEKELLKPSYKKLVLVANNADELLEKMNNFIPLPTPARVNKNET